MDYYLPVSFLIFLLWTAAVCASAPIFLTKITGHDIEKLLGQNGQGAVARIAAQFIVSKVNVGRTASDLAVVLGSECP